MLVKWVAQALFLLLTNFRQILNQKNIISTYAKDFSWEKWLKLTRFPKNKPNQQFLMISSIDLAKNIEGFFFLKFTFICKMLPNLAELFSG
jgi:hypothetical protein